LRQSIAEFERRNAAVIVLGPDGPNAFRKYWQEHDLPFTGLADLRSRVAGRYEQEVNLFKLGRMPALFVIDLQGVVRFAHYGDSMADIPSNAVVLAALDEILREAQAEIGLPPGA
jgi:peroxiredoxin